MTDSRTDGGRHGKQLEPPPQIEDPVTDEAERISVKETWDQAIAAQDELTATQDEAVRRLAEAEASADAIEKQREQDRLGHILMVRQILVQRAGEQLRGLSRSGPQGFSWQGVEHLTRTVEGLKALDYLYEPVVLSDIQSALRDIERSIDGLPIG